MQNIKKKPVLLGWGPHSLADCPSDRLINQPWATKDISEAMDNSPSIPFIVSAIDYLLSRQSIIGNCGQLDQVPTSVHSQTVEKPTVGNKGHIEGNGQCECLRRWATQSKAMDNRELWATSVLCSEVNSNVSGCNNQSHHLHTNKTNLILKVRSASAIRCVSIALDKGWIVSATTFNPAFKSPSTIMVR